MKQIRLSKNTSVLQAAWAADMVPETATIVERTEKGIIMEGLSLGNNRLIRVEIIFEEQKEEGNGRFKINDDVGAGS